MSRSRRTRDNGAVSASLSVSEMAVSILVVLAMVLVVFTTATKIARKRHAKRGAGNLFTALCADPRHGVWKSRDSSSLRPVRKRVLTVLKGGVWSNKRTRVCEDCIGKMVNKPDFRRLLKVVVRMTKDDREKTRLEKHGL